MSLKMLRRKRLINLPFTDSSSSQEKLMTKNVGGIDRVLRVVIGLVLIALAATGNVGWWGYLGVIPLATAAMGWCPPYALLGWSTCAARKPS
jgi:Protein of unknown function (DUF2892)